MVEALSGNLIERKKERKKFDSKL